VKRKPGMAVLLICLGLLHLAVFAAGFLSQYDVAEQNREFPFAPPTRIHFVDAQGAMHLLSPFVYRMVEDSRQFGSYHEDAGRCYPIRFFVHGHRYKLAGSFASNVHLLGVDPPGHLFLMGTDEYGRDQFSRFLHGGQISLAAGLLATILSLGIAVLLGTVSGFYGGWLDAIVMRFGELFVALPWLYLLFGLRAFLPLNIDPRQAFLLLIAVIGSVGWARPARLIRGVVLSGKEQNYVLAARMFGGSRFYLMRRHILPQTYSIILTQAVLLIPQYILAEVTLSFLGLGVGEPEPSWGNMLASVQQYHVMASYWWMLIPGIALVPVFLSYVLLANTLQARAT
jgi:peptide/nickel transport system permease protein